MLKPKALKIGDKVAIIAPSSATDLKSVENGEKKIKALGLNPVMFSKITGIWQRRMKKEPGM